MVRFFTLLALFGLGLFQKPTYEELPEETEETAEVEETPTPEIDEEAGKLLDTLKAFAEKAELTNIINWFINSGAMVAIVGVLTKYRKYKSMTIEEMLEQFKGKVEDKMGESFKELSSDSLNKLCDKISDLEHANETIMKVLVLMQDNTAKGRAALIEYLGSKTSSQEVKEAANEVQEELKAQEEQKEQVKQAFEDIF